MASVVTSAFCGILPYARSKSHSAARKSPLIALFFKAIKLALAVLVPLLGWLSTSANSSAKPGGFLF